MAKFCLTLMATASAVALAQKLQLEVDEKGSFTVDLDGNPWLAGGEVRVGHQSTVNGGLVLKSRQQDSGKDELGEYESMTLKWAFSQRDRVLMHTSFRTYPNDGGVVLFEQHFPEELQLPAEPWGQNTSCNPCPPTAPVTLFPSFYSTSKAARELDCFSYHQVFPRLKNCMLSTYRATHQGGAPLVLYDSNSSRGGLAPMTVFSPLNYPKAHHMFSAHGLVGAGIKGTVGVIPSGWRQLFMLSSAWGINDGMMAWGDHMLRFTGKSRADMFKDDSIGSIGFWTDNGGYYHYSTGGSNETYEEVLPKVKAYHKSIGVPFRHWQFDSWFYPKDGKVDAGGGGGAVKNWTALPSVFPRGMAYIQSKLRVPMVMHNRQWSPTSDYVKHESFKWYKSKHAAIPEDPEAFFKSFFKQQEGWGLAMYEQDWMCKEYDEVEALQTNISLADAWLRGMASGAESSGRTVQYCMPYPYDILSASAYGAVTNARASDDYIARDQQWQIGATSIFYWALGILPFKDGFYSSNLPQVGGQTVGPETSPDRHALMSAMSCAMVGPMDGIHLMNASRVMSTCRSDGKILKPDRPLMPLESCFASGVDPGRCLNYFTYSEHASLGRITYLFMNSPGELSLPDVVMSSTAAGQVEEYAVYNWYTSSVRVLNASSSGAGRAGGAAGGSLLRVEPGYEGHGYVVISPVKHGWALLGEPGKFISASRLRIVSVAWQQEQHSSSSPSSSLSVGVEGIKGEQVKICALERSTEQVQCQSVGFSQTIVVNLTFGNADVDVIV